MNPSPANGRRFFARATDERILTGTAAGLARALGVDRFLIRSGLVLLVFASGIGVGVYLIAFAFSDAPGSPGRVRPVTDRHTIGLLCVVFGLLMFANGVGLLLAPGVLLPLVFILGAASLVWMRSSDEERTTISRDPVQAMLAGRHALWRLFLGILLFAAGMVIFVDQSSAFASASGALAAIAATSLGAILLVGPWLVQLYRQLLDERRFRIRSEERAEMSAHLHDSVLQTLTLIQRADVSKEVAALARRQERELRAWMQGKTAVTEATLRSAIDEIVERIESQYAVVVEAVVVGDTAASDDVSALTSAIQESVVNAARHSGTESISLFVEVEPKIITAYVRDAGCGFETSRVPLDRQGLSESIEGRMRRSGGNAVIHSAPGQGTEVELRLPLESK